MIILAFIPEGTWRGPALDDEVRRLLKALEILAGIETPMQALDRRPAHEAGDDAAAGKAVQHGDLFGHAAGRCLWDTLGRLQDSGPCRERGTRMCHPWSPHR